MRKCKVNGKARAKAAKVLHSIETKKKLFKTKIDREKNENNY